MVDTYNKSAHVINPRNELRDHENERDERDAYAYYCYLPCAIFASDHDLRMCVCECVFILIAPVAGLRVSGCLLLQPDDTCVNRNCVVKMRKALTMGQHRTDLGRNKAQTMRDLIELSTRTSRWV